MERVSRFYRPGSRRLALLSRQFGVWLIACTTLVDFTGCQSWMSKEKEKNNQFVKETKRFKELLSDPDRPRLIGEVAAALGMSSRHYDSYGLVSNLPNTGGIVKPGKQREIILAEMRTRDIDQPEMVLDLPSTALVKLRIYANPCDIKGEVVDMDVEVSTECTATDITEGVVMESRLREMAVLNGDLRQGDDKAIGLGDVVLLPTTYTKKPDMTPLQGVVIGGARLNEEQKLGLRINPDFRHVIVTKAIEKAINSRFFYQDANKQRLVAEGKNDWHIIISSVPKYKYDPVHFMSVVLATGFAETSSEQQERLIGCKALLAKRETARRAAAELESIGNDEAKALLVEALASSDPEVRFYSAYSLAYLDRKESVPVLMELARYEPAFRPLCLVGLSVNEESIAREALEELLQESEPELRYGAYWAIRHRNPTDMTVAGEKITTGSKNWQSFQFSQVPSSTPLLVASLQHKKEIVLFGNSTKVTLTGPVSPTPHLTLSPVMGDQIKMTKRHINGEILNSVVSSDIVAILRGMSGIQANYNDVVHTVDALSNKRALASPIAFNPRPFAGREYVRKKTTSADSGTDDQMEVIKIDNSSVGKPDSDAASWWSPVSWWKPSKGTPKRTSMLDKSEPSPPEITDEELALLNQ